MSRLHPRPLLQREQWLSADGAWGFALDQGAVYRAPGEVPFGMPARFGFSPSS